MKKLLFAINHKEAERLIADKIKASYEIVGVVQYREAVFTSLKSTGADTLLIRESLSGSGDFLKFIKTIRERFPTVRIICMINERESVCDPILSSLVSLGIYDIINHNKVSVNEIASYILNQKTFADVHQYYDGVPEAFTPKDAQSSSNSSKKKGGRFKVSNKKDPGLSIVCESELSTDTELNIESMRLALEEEANRKAQQKIESLSKDMAKKETEKLQKLLNDKDSELSELKFLLAQKEEICSQEYDKSSDAQVHLEALRKELSDTQKNYKQVVNEYEQRIASLVSTENPEWFKKKSEEWEKTSDEYISQIKSLEETINTLKAEMLKKSTQKVDLSGNDDMTIIMPDDPNRADEAPPEKNRVFMFMGSKHGVGNSTIALNTAVALSMRGHKTLFIEFNSAYPMVSGFFEFIDIKNGIDTAVSGIAEGEYKNVDAAIIKPFGLTTNKSQLMNAYKQLPGALHFMFFSNAFLLKKKQFYDNNYLSQLFSYLLDELNYSYIVIDVQPDDETGRYLLMNSEGIVDRFILTCTQDIHSVATAGLIINDMVNAGLKNTLKRMRIAVNMYSPDYGLNLMNISKWLNIPLKKFYKISEDRRGYLDAGHNAIPYILNKGQYFKEYSTLSLIF